MSSLHGGISQIHINPPPLTPCPGFLSHSGRCHGRSHRTTPSPQAPGTSPQACPCMCSKPSFTRRPCVRGPLRPPRPRGPPSLRDPLPALRYGVEPSARVASPLPALVPLPVSGSARGVSDFSMPCRFITGGARRALRRRSPPTSAMYRCTRSGHVRIEHRFGAQFQAKSTGPLVHHVRAQPLASDRASIFTLTDSSWRIAYGVSARLQRRRTPSAPSTTEARRSTYALARR